jgi:hypothetical protein
MQWACKHAAGGRERQRGTNAGEQTEKGVIEIRSLGWEEKGSRCLDHLPREIPHDWLSLHHEVSTSKCDVGVPPSKKKTDGVRVNVAHVVEEDKHAAWEKACWDVMEKLGCLKKDDEEPLQKARCKARCKLNLGVVCEGFQRFNLAVCAVQCPLCLS